MIKNKEYCMHDLGKDMGFVISDLKDIKTCLYGKKENAESKGLVDIVRENTNFRRKASRILTVT